MGLLESIKGRITIRLVFYSIAAILIIYCFIMIICITYADSINPMDFLGRDNINYSYMGKPVYAHIASGSSGIQFNGKKNDRGILIATGRSLIILYPFGDGTITLTAPDGSIMKYGGPIILRTDGPNKARIYMDMIRVDNFSFNMDFSYENNVNDFTHWNNMLNFQNLGDKYVLFSKYENGSYKTYGNSFRETINQSMNAFNNQISVTGSELIVNGTIDYSRFTSYQRQLLPILYRDDAYLKKIYYGFIPLTDMYHGGTRVNNYQGSINFTGEINILTDGELFMYIPVESVMATRGTLVNMEQADGGIEIKNRVYTCNGADNIQISGRNPQHNTYLSMLNNQFQVYGNADEIHFRYMRFEHPLEVFIKEGDIALFTGILSGLLALTLRHIVGELKKK